MSQQGSPQQPEQVSNSPLPLQHDIAKTTVWMNVYSPSSLLDGQPMPPGTVVEARDSQGVPCGQFVVANAGKYGLMPVYGDDLSTAADEGAAPGDAITFWVNGVQASPTPAAVVWTAYGDLQRVDLEASSLATPAQTQSWVQAVASKISGAFQRLVSH